MENWIDLDSLRLDMNQFRVVADTIPSTIVDLSDMMYPLQGARKKKRKEIIYPKTVNSMRDLQSDSTLFATFSQPGYYNKKDPRTTELGRLNQLISGGLYETNNNLSGKREYEIKVRFKDRFGERVTQLIVGGLNLSEIPVLPISEANRGWKNSMGIGNHPFYERYEDHVKLLTRVNGYYGLLLNDSGEWLDSHRVGIDGPVLHFSDSNRTTLHLWLLSFERHAFVGHYRFNLANDSTQIH